MRLLRTLARLCSVVVLLSAVVSTSGCKKSEASDLPRDDQATPRDTVNAVFRQVVHCDGSDLQMDKDPSSDEEKVARLEALDDKRVKLVHHLRTVKEPLSDEEKDVERLFLDRHSASVLVNILSLARLVDVVDETPLGDSVELRVNVRYADTNQVFLFELRKKGPNWVIEDFKARGVPEGVYAIWHKETGK